MIPMHTDPTKIYGTTVIAVRRDNHVVISGDGQVSYGDTIIQHKASNVRPPRTQTPPRCCGEAAP